ATRQAGLRLAGYADRNRQTPISSANPPYGSLRGLLHRLGGCAMVLLLHNARRFAAPSAQEGELGAAHFAAAHNLDGVDHRGIERKDAFHAFAIGDLANGKILVQAGTGAPDADALIGLDARALALDHLIVDEQRIAWAEIGNLLAGREFCNLLLFELLNDIHGNSPSAASVPQRGFLCFLGRRSFYDMGRSLSRT